MFSQIFIFVPSTRMAPAKIVATMSNVDLEEYNLWGERVRQLQRHLRTQKQSMCLELVRVRKGSPQQPSNFLSRVGSLKGFEPGPDCDWAITGICEGETWRPEEALEEGVETIPAFAGPSPPLSAGHWGPYQPDPRESHEMFVLMVHPWGQDSLVLAKMANLGPKTAVAINGSFHWMLCNEMLSQNEMDRPCRFHPGE